MKMQIEAHAGKPELHLREAQVPRIVLRSRALQEARLQVRTEEPIGTPQQTTALSSSRWQKQQTFVGMSLFMQRRQTHTHQGPAGALHLVEADLLQHVLCVL